MAMLTVRNIPDHVYLALRSRAAAHGRSTAAEVRAILEAAVKPESRVKLGTLIASIGRRAALSEDEFEVFNQRDRTPAKPSLGARPRGCDRR